MFFKVQKSRKKKALSFDIRRPILASYYLSIFTLNDGVY
jgi:hypothetical protein